MAATKLLFLTAFVLFGDIPLSQADTISAIVTKTDSCFGCGMIENTGQLDVKVCGQSDCCFVAHLDNSEINFQSGDEDVFEGAGSLFECNNFQV
jgi:hypothetical protein